MAKQSINIGTSANDRTGDSLRSAFNKINENFTDLYTALGLDSGGLNLGSFEFTGSVLTTTDSSAIVIDQATTITSNLTVGGDVVPSVAYGGDLGTADKPWNSLYVSGNTVFIGGTPVRINENGDLTVDGSVVTSGTVSYNDLTDKPAIPSVGDITFTNSTISAADDTSITIQALDEDSVLRSRISLSPDVGAVSMRGYSRESSDTFNTSDWDTATWTTNGGGGVVTIVNAAAINDFINNDLGSATGITFSINGGTAESLGSRSYSGLSQTLTLNTADAPDPDPTTVTEIEFFYSFSSRIGIDYDDGSVSMSARGSMNVSINSERDINLTADDDVSIEGADTFNLINTSTTAPIRIITDDTNNSYTWEFEADGGLTFPDATVQSTAYPGPQTTLDGDVTGSVFADNSTLLVDGVAGKIVGPIETASTITVTADGNGTLTSSSGYAQLSGDNGSELWFDNGALVTSVIGVEEDSIGLVVTDMTPGSSSQSSLAMSSAGNTTLASAAWINLITNNGPSAKTFRFDSDGVLTLPAGGSLSGGVSYSPSTDAHWTDPNPTTVADALDRLAGAIYAANGGSSI